MLLAKGNNRIAMLLLAALLALACLPGLALAAPEDAPDAAKAAVAAAAGEAAEGQEDGRDPQPSANDDGHDAGTAQLTLVERALENRATADDTAYEAIDADSAGTVFTLQNPISGTAIEGDLFWAAGQLDLSGSRVGNDLLAVGREVDFRGSDIGNDVRLAGQDVSFQRVVVQGNVNLAALDISIDRSSAAVGYYCGGGSVSFAGKAKRFIAYGQSIYFDGVVEGDVTLSAQDIVIGPHARVTGTLDIRSGQNLEVLSIPETAQIAHIDTTLNQPNTIDQITQLRASIAPYFQVGSLLFVVVSFILLGLAMYWGFGHKLTEANRLIRRYPLAVVVLACIALMLMFVGVTLGALLVFTLPFAAVMVLVLLLAALCCVPFTGASLALMLRRRIRPVLCVVLGSGLGAALLFVPQVNVVVFAASMVYFVGYLINIAMFGHDEKHDASFHHRETDDQAPRGKASGILPVVTPEEAAGGEDGGAAPDAAVNEEWYVEGEPEDELGAEETGAPAGDAVEPEGAGEAGSAEDTGSPEDTEDAERTGDAGAGEGAADAR